jgi:hypothetical protein
LTEKSGDPLFDVMPPDAESTDWSAWEIEVELIADRLLHDHDFEMDDLVGDQSPEVVQTMKATLGIDDGYFTAIAPDPKDLGPIKQTLKRLVQGQG